MVLLLVLFVAFDLARVVVFLAVDARAVVLLLRVVVDFPALVVVARGRVGVFFRVVEVRLEVAGDADATLASASAVVALLRVVLRVVVPSC